MCDYCVCCWGECEYRGHEALSFVFLASYCFLDQARRGLQFGLGLIVLALVPPWPGIVLASARVLGSVFCGFQFQHSTMRYSYRGKVEGRVSVSYHVWGGVFV
jgi:hypothetical protein